MKAYIKSIKFKKIDNEHCYWQLTLVDEYENKKYFGNPNLSDYENFRKQTFGILSACNCYNILQLGGENIVPLNIYIVQDSFDNIMSIKNLSGDEFKYDRGMPILNKHLCFLKKYKPLESEEQRKIVGIISRSGIFSVETQSKIYFQFFYDRTSILWFWISSRRIFNRSRLFTKIIKTISSIY